MAYCSHCQRNNHFVNDERPLKNRRLPTTLDIARLSGFSRATVSAVLNGTRKVSEGTRAKIIECMHSQDYESGLIAKSLVGTFSRMVVVLTPDLGSPFHMMVFRGINAALYAQGYHVMVHSVHAGDENDPDTLAALKSYRPGGFIILRGAEGINDFRVHELSKEGVPVLIMGLPCKNVETLLIGLDERTGIKIATDYVISMGHRKLAYIDGGAKERRLGFVESLFEHKLQDSVTIVAGPSAREGYEATLKALSDPANRPTALVCFSDMVAVGAYRAIRELHLDIPKDISVIGFDGIEFSELLSPPLTTVDISPLDIGTRCAELLLRAIKNQLKKGRGSYEWIKPQLVERASVRRL